MKIVKGVDGIGSPLKYAVMTIGNFDGVHIGHQAIISKVVARAKKKKSTSVLMLFDPHPRTFFNPEIPQKQITNLENRVALIEELGIDLLIVQPFDKQFASIEAREFVLKYLVKNIGVAELFVSSKFRFGKNAGGGLDLLRIMSEQHGFKLEITENVHFRHTVVSSSFIRESILEGEMEIARRMLGRIYTIHGKVYPDTQRGTTIFKTPTSNIMPENELIPALGIYAGVVYLPEGKYPAATYIGTRPTFEGKEVVIETHLIGYHGSLYGQRISIGLLKKIRDDMKFAHLSDLLVQIIKDIDDVKEYLLNQGDDPELAGLIWLENQ